LLHKFTGTHTNGILGSLTIVGFRWYVRL